MIVRHIKQYMDGELIREESLDIDWDTFRQSRNEYLIITDHHALQDRVMSDEMRDFREFLRELPQNFPGDNANAALDAWADYEIPEGV